MTDENMQTDDERFPKLEQDGWNGALRQQEEQNRVMEEQRRNAAMAEQIGANRGVYDGYARMGNAVAARRAQFVSNANAHLASALRLAAENGGRIPQYAWQGLGGGLGLDGKNGAIVGGGYDRKGGFTLMVARRNQQTGQVEQAPMTFTPMDQYGLMLSAPGIFSRQEVDGMRRQLIDNYHMHPDQVPEAPQGWGETGRVGIGNRTASGGTSVNPNWLYGPQRHSTISAFGSNGRGGFTQYYSGEETGNQLVSQDFGARAAENKGRWKVLSRGADPNSDDGTQVTRYENDKTGEVVYVRDGETPPWESRAGSEKERIARMNNETRERVQQQRGSAQREVAQVTADATKHKADASVEVAAQNGRAKTARGGRQSNAEDLASVRRILDKNSGATPEQRSAAINKLLGIADRYERDISTSDKDRALKKADDIIDLYGGDMSGFPIKDKEQIRKIVAGELYAGKEYDPDEWSSYFDDLRAQRAKKTSKAEVKTGDNGGGNGKQFKEGDVQEINGIKMKLLPSKKNPGKLTWQRV